MDEAPLEGVAREAGFGDAQVGDRDSVAGIAAGSEQDARAGLAVVIRILVISIALASRVHRTQAASAD